VIDRERDREIDKIDTESNEIEMMNIGLLFTRKGGKRKKCPKKMRPTTEQDDNHRDHNM
jgi:hypothetical protein